MPVIVIGADTELGHAIVSELRPASGEIRLFASSEDAVARYRSSAKIAVGDISDGTHVGGAAIGAFCAIVIASAAHDDRERHFAATPADLFAQWSDGLADAGVSRVILVGASREIPAPVRLDRICDDYVVIDTTDKTPDQIAVEAAGAEARPV